MTELETRIIEAAKNVPNYNGYGYKLRKSLSREIARIMGYEICTFRYGEWNFKNLDEMEKIRMIIDGMEAKGIIKKSKSGMAYKMI